jgi:hypothetical protein
MENAIWSATLWGPTWLRGGLLFLMTARTFDAERRQARLDRSAHAPALGRFDSCAAP